MIALSKVDAVLRLARLALIECGRALDDSNTGGAPSYDDAMDAIDGALAALADHTPQVDVSGLPLSGQLYGMADMHERNQWPSAATALRAAGRALDAGFKTCGRADCAGACGGKASVPGWKWVPVEPTPEMLRHTHAGAASYRALLAAAPEVKP